jgi:hypothetical protein
MFAHLRAHPILTVTPNLSVEEAVHEFITGTDGALPVRWLQFPSAVLLCVAATNDLKSGAFFVLDCKRGIWLWIYLEEDPYRSYGGDDFDRLVQDYDLLSLVERPALLGAGMGWILEPGKPAEMTCQD